MVERRKEAPMNTSKTSRMLVATAVVSALAILLVTPAQAYWVNEGGSSTPTAVVGNPGDSSWISEQAPQTVGNPGDSAQGSAVETAVLTSSGSGGFDTQTFALIAGGALLALMLCGGAFMLASRHRRVALP
jgi:hypothetical protein